MESIDDNFDRSKFEISAVSMENLRLIARWASFLSILGFVFTALMVMASIFMMSMGDDTRFSETDELSPSVTGFIYLVMSGIGFFPIYFLFRFATKMNASLNEKNALTFDEATGFLRSHYTFNGVMAIIFLALFVLMILFAILQALQM